MSLHKFITDPAPGLSPSTRSLHPEIWTRTGLEQGLYRYFTGRKETSERHQVFSEANIWASWSKAENLKRSCLHGRNRNRFWLRPERWLEATIVQCNPFSSYLSNYIILYHPLSVLRMDVNGLIMSCLWQALVVSIFPSGNPPRLGLPSHHAHVCPCKLGILAFVSKRIKEPVAVYLHVKKASVSTNMGIWHLYNN